MFFLLIVDLCHTFDCQCHNFGFYHNYYFLSQNRNLVRHNFDFYLIIMTFISQNCNLVRHNFDFYLIIMTFYLKIVI